MQFPKLPKISDVDKKEIAWMVALVAAMFLGFNGGLRSATPSVETVHIQTGRLSAMPADCTSGTLYVAVDVSSIQQLQVCHAGSYEPYLSVGGSGALKVESNTLDIVTKVLPRLAEANVFTGKNTFASFQLQASTAGCRVTSDFGRVDLDTSDALNTKLRVCGYVKGKLQWARAPLL